MLLPLKRFGENVKTILTRLKPGENEITIDPTLPRERIDLITTGVVTGSVGLTLPRDGTNLISGYDQNLAAIDAGVELFRQGGC